jgi:hypothetical protein
MQFSLNKLCRRGERTLPRFSSMFPAQATSRAVPEDVAVDGDMTLGGLPPLNATSATAEGASALALDTPATAAEDSNEIATAFASLDAEAADVAEPDRALPPEFRCRYRQGKCSQPRTLKKNGSMHSYCEHHRLLSVRNQKVFDEKRRRQREQAVAKPVKRPRRSRSSSSGSDSDDDDDHDERRSGCEALR